jgi:predicted nucleic acid-binding protein
MPGGARPVVVDASVALKWFFRDARREDHVEQALDVLHAVAAGRCALVQPPHFIAEVGAVLAREMPAPTARTCLRDLLDIEMEIAETEALYRRAMALSSQLDHHVFDTLYHAVALEAGASAVLVTADERYAAKALRLGGIVRLADFGSLVA